MNESRVSVGQLRAWADHPAENHMVPIHPDTLRKIADEIAGQREAIGLAYGYLWHVNNEPVAPIRLRSVEQCAYDARRALRGILTGEQRGEAICKTGQLIGAYPTSGPPCQFCGGVGCLRCAHSAVPKP